MKISEGHMVIFKAWIYYLVAQFTPVAGLLETAADAKTQAWPSMLQVTAAMVGGFIAGLVAVRAYFDGSNARYEANKANGTITTESIEVTTTAKTTQQEPPQQAIAPPPPVSSPSQPASSPVAGIVAPNSPLPEPVQTQPTP